MTLLTLQEFADELDKIELELKNVAGKPRKEIVRAGVELHARLAKVKQHLPLGLPSAQADRFHDVVVRLLQDVFGIDPGQPSATQQERALIQVRNLLRCGEDRPSPDDHISVERDDSPDVCVHVKHKNMWHRYRINLTWVEAVDGPT